MMTYRFRRGEKIYNELGACALHGPLFVYMRKMIVKNEGIINLIWPQVGCDGYVCSEKV